MAFSLRKSPERGTVGIDLDGDFVAAVQADHGRIQRAASTQLPDGVMADGEVTDPAGLASALKSFISETGLPRNVRLGVANQQIVVRVIDLPPIENEADRAAAVRFQAAEAIAMPLEEAILDHQVAGVGRSPDGGESMRIVLVAARRSMIESIVGAARSAGLKPEGIDLDAFALVRMLAADAPASDSASVYCHLAGVTNLAIAVGRACYFTRPLSSGWIDDDAASALADEVRLSIDYYMAQPQALRVGELVLSGPGSRDQELVARLGELVALPSRVAEPLSGLDRSALDPNEDAHRYTVAAGLALGAAA